MVDVEEVGRRRAVISGQSRVIRVSRDVSVSQSKSCNVDASNPSNLTLCAFLPSLTVTKRVGTYPKWSQRHGKIDTLQLAFRIESGAVFQKGHQEPGDGCTSPVQSVSEGERL